MRPNADMLTTVQERTKMAPVNNYSQMFSQGVMSYANGNGGQFVSGQMGSMVTSGLDQATNELFGDSVGGAVVSGVLSAVIGQILAGNFTATQKEMTEAQQSLSDAQAMQANAQATANDAKAKGLEQYNVTLNAVEGYQAEIQGNADAINTSADETTGIIQTHTELAVTNGEQINANNEKIQQEQARMAQLDSQINQKITQLNLQRTEQKVSGDNKNGEDDGKGFQLLMKNTGDPELDALIAERNGISATIQNLQNQNLVLSGEVTESSEVTAEQLNAVAEVTTEQAASIDEQAELIFQTIGKGDAAIKEITNLLQGQLPKFDAAMAKKVATQMTKAAVNGTNSGVLAAMAATLGASSIVSFGATADKAANATKGSVEYGADSLKNTAVAVAEKGFEQFINSYMNQQISKLSEITGVDIAGLVNTAQSFKAETIDTTNMAYNLNSEDSIVQDTQEQLLTDAQDAQVSTA